MRPACRALRAPGAPEGSSAAALLAWAALAAAAVNALQKVLLWLEIHGHIAQPLPALAAACGAITFALATSAALFAALGAIAAPTLVRLRHVVGAVAMSDVDRLLAEQVDYYRERAGEYEDWWFRRGRYDHGDEANAAWFAEAAEVQADLERFAPAGQRAGAGVRNGPMDRTARRPRHAT